MHRQTIGKQSGKDSILQTLHESLRNDLKSYSNPFVFTNPVKGFWHHEINDIYSFVDYECSIKLYFNEKTLKDNLENLPEKLGKHELNNIAITLTSYSFDYLVYNINDLLSYKWVCYVDAFDLDTKTKKNIDPFPENVNLNPSIKAKSLSVFNKIIQDLVLLNTSETDSTSSNNNNLLTAKNFVLHNYNMIKNNYKSLNTNIYDLFKQRHHIKQEMFLLKQKIGWSNSEYWFDDNNSKTKHMLKAIDWKVMYTLMPSVVDSGEVNSFNPDKTPLTGLLEKISYVDKENKIKVSQWEIDQEVCEENVSRFLQMKKKRWNDKEFETKTIPFSVKKWMKSYGDVLVNMNKNDLDKYKHFINLQESVNK